VSIWSLLRTCPGAGDDYGGGARQLENPGSFDPAAPTTPTPAVGADIFDPVTNEVTTHQPRSTTTTPGGGGGGGGWRSNACTRHAAQAAWLAARAMPGACPAGCAGARQRAADERLRVPLLQRNQGPAQRRSFPAGQSYCPGGRGSLVLTPAAPINHPGRSLTCRTLPAGVAAPITLAAAAAPAAPPTDVAAAPGGHAQAEPCVGPTRPAGH